MKLCSSCSAQFEDEFKRCLHCGSKLKPFPGGARAPTSTRVVSPEPELVLVQRGGVAEVRSLSGVMDRMSIAHQIEVDERPDDEKSGRSPSTRTTLSVYVARHDEERARQAIQTLALGELSTATNGDAEHEGDAESELARRVGRIGNAIGLIVTVLIMLGMLLRAFGR